jgi:hypothetical protein
MGTDLYLILNKKQVAHLGRAYNYDKYDFIPTKTKTIRDIIAHIAYMPKDHQELLDIVYETIDSLENLCEDAIVQGKTQLLDSLREQGFETMTDYEWEEQNKVKDMPDYFEPKV